MSAAPRDKALRAAAYIVAAAGLAEIARQILGTRPLAAEVLGAFAADLVAGRALAASWYGGKESGKAALRGGLVATGAVLLALGLALVIGKAKVAGFAMGWDTLPFGAITALATAIRIELPCRVLPLALFRDLAPRPYVIAFALVAGAAPTLAELPLRPGSIALAVGIGALSVAMIETTGSALAAVVAHATIRFVTGPLLTSSADVRWSTGSLSPLERADGIGAWLVAAMCVGAAVAVARLGRASRERER
jgi:hypothetical protein